ncbi:CPBP family intramembrane glutamic endopeptidase [Bryobacter aggregatus]|uniref:CPBP family intramembrane glutamic endopeptidase n=1 Tax=Bryobacter aggregatus TaxID=360054 RepID=UPI0004E1F79B|nr:CPBP family intramembrane glutamic endopeptidase [Bryobacter aggregatus]
MEPREENPVWTYEDLGILLGMILPVLLLASLAARLFALWIPQKGVLAALVQILLYLGVGGSLFVLLRTRYDLAFWKALSWRIPWPRMALTALLGPVLAIVMALVAVGLNTPREGMVLDSLLQDRWSLVAIGLVASTVGPLFEELIFRGFAQPLFIRSLGVAGGLLATAVPFALLHGPQYNWNWQRLLILTLASIAFGAERQRTGSTAASTLMHAAYNLTFVAGMMSQGGRLNQA